MNVLDSAVDAVMDLIDAMDLYAPIRRGALGTGDGICCQIGPSAPQTVFMDKNQYIILDLVINAKHSRLDVVSDALNRIHERLTMMHKYPKKDAWCMVDIQTLTEPQVIAREDDGRWLMASSLNVKIETTL